MKQKMGVIRCLPEPYERSSNSDAWQPLGVPHAAFAMMLFLTGPHERTRCGHNDIKDDNDHTQR